MDQRAVGVAASSSASNGLTPRSSCAPTRVVIASRRDRAASLKKIWGATSWNLPELQRTCLTNNEGVNRASDKAKGAISTASAIAAALNTSADAANKVRTLGRRW